MNSVKGNRSKSAYRSGVKGTKKKKRVGDPVIIYLTGTFCKIIYVYGEYCQTPRPK